MTRRDRHMGRNLIGDFTDPALVSLLTEWLEASGGNELDIVTGDDERLKIVLESRAVSQAAAPSPVRKELKIRAPLAGHFVDVHPVNGSNTPDVGQKIEKGATAGFISVGPVLVPVIASESIVIRDRPFRSGDLVGYGDIILIAELV